ncbi:MAG: T9SS type A sorting domain-containing protein [Flavobacterium micromati]|nr:T9SS type A sorting domain-containing protein [Flavobacterium micromati]
MKQTLLILLIATSAFSQKISKQIISSAGNTQINSGQLLSWSLGEPTIGLMTTNENQLSNGYFPFLNLAILSREDFKLDAKINVFPNPTTYFLFVEQEDHNSLEIVLSDIGGKIIIKRKVESGSAIDVSSFTQGLYVVQVKDLKTNKKNAYKIVKK